MLDEEAALGVVLVLPVPVRAGADAFGDTPKADVDPAPACTNERPKAPFRVTRLSQRLLQVSSVQASRKV